ncbi:TetR/AcrR family transcriptional regulator [Nocardia huaxiensis]|uniref:TetR/AcrR family transcriptional regulator n=1 Tax=Nocardia huaxiensis TaxID=2755382 RepID=A0A7D6VBS9_9NOCA|nr:TetR/AcrR family transcriptional regulator [Nocardia huaxiensis]QLY31311.1 TetR/AcrR family transcriptional regulator [Nocardia huaxiensis]UFS94854.1 TetR/AcrR family transcriptional regulator [Nocardia huaxiensis]
MTAKSQVESAWTRPQRQRRETPALSRKQIVDEAIALLDSEGVDNLSMRRLGTRLNAGATSLYTHVANKEELLQLVVDQVFGEVRVPEQIEAGNWRRDLTEMSRGVRDTLLRHPWMTIVMSSAGLVYLGPNIMRMSEAMLTIMEVAGFPDEAGDRASNALFSYIFGSSSGEAAMLTTVARSGMPEQEWFEQIMATSEQLARPYPRVHKRYVAHQGIDAASGRKDAFEQELGLFLDGLELRRRAL